MWRVSLLFGVLTRHGRATTRVLHCQVSSHGRGPTAAPCQPSPAATTPTKGSVLPYLPSFTLICSYCDTVRLRRVSTYAESNMRLLCAGVRVCGALHAMLQHTPSLRIMHPFRHSPSSQQGLRTMHPCRHAYTWHQVRDAGILRVPPILCVRSCACNK